MPLRCRGATMLPSSAGTPSCSGFVPLRRGRRRRGRSVVDVLGEPGIGKSRLAREFVGASPTRRPCSSAAVRPTARRSPSGRCASCSAEPVATRLWRPVQPRDLRRRRAGARRARRREAGRRRVRGCPLGRVRVPRPRRVPGRAARRRPRCSCSASRGPSSQSGGRPGCSRRRRRGRSMPLSDADSQCSLEELGAPAAVAARIADTAEGNPLFVEQLAAIADERARPRCRLDPRRPARAARPARARRALGAAARRRRRPKLLARGGARAHGAGRARPPAGPPARARPQGAPAPRPGLSGDGFRFQHALIRDAAYDALPKATARSSMSAWPPASISAGGDALVGYHLEQRISPATGARTRRPRARRPRRASAAAAGTSVRSQRPARDDLLLRAAHGLAPGRRRGAPALLTELGYARHQGRRLRRRSDRSTPPSLRRRLQVGRPSCAPCRAPVRPLLVAGDAGVENVRLAREVIPELERLGDELGLARAWWLKSESDALACRWLARAEALERALAHAHRAETGLDVAGTVSGLLSLALALRADTCSGRDCTG